MVGSIKYYFFVPRPQSNVKRHPKTSVECTISLLPNHRDTTGRSYSFSYPSGLTITPAGASLFPVQCTPQNSSLSLVVKFKLFSFSLPCPPSSFIVFSFVVLSSFRLRPDMTFAVDWALNNTYLYISILFPVAVFCVLPSSSFIPWILLYLKFTCCLFCLLFPPRSGVLRMQK